MPMKNNTIEAEVANYAVEYREKHYRLAFSYVKNVDDALDIVQESTLKAISSARTLKNPGYIKTWFYRIIVNTALDFLRKEGRVRPTEEELLEFLNTQAMDHYRDFDLEEALDRLPDGHRTIVILRFFEDLKIKEIAEILNENINTVKTRLYKSLEFLRVELESYQEGA